MAIHEGDISEKRRQASRARWGPQRVVRLDELTADQRRLVLALVDAAKAGNREAEGGRADASQPTG